MDTNDGSDLRPAVPLEEYEDNQDYSNPMELLKNVAKLRTKLINKMTKGGTVIPDDDGVIQVIGGLLRDAEKVPLAQLKIAADKDNTNTNKVIASQLAEAFTRFPVLRGTDGLPVSESVTPVLPDLGISDFLPGETEIGKSGENSETFLTRMGQGNEDEDA